MLSCLRCFTEREKKLLTRQTVAGGKIKPGRSWNNTECSRWKKCWAIWFGEDPWVPWHLQQSQTVRFAWFLVRKRCPTNMLRVSVIHAARVRARAVGTERWLVHAARLHYAFHGKRYRFFLLKLLIWENFWSWFFAASPLWASKWRVIE